MLQLENFTRDDIKSFVQDQLLSPGYSDLAAISPQGARKIITDIVDKSRGVFLWVSVISGLLKSAIQEGATISDLQATIDNFPSEVADLFDYIWDRTSKQFRAEASQYFRLLRICQRHETKLLALTVWFGHKEFPVHFDAASVTSIYLTGVIKTLERRLMSRTGGLLELVSPNDDHTKRPEDVRLDYMHRTANDWVRGNWASITAMDPGFDPFFYFVKGQALRIVLTTASITGDIMKLADWPNFLNIAALIPEDHPEKGILVAALDRLDIHLTSHKPVYLCRIRLHWSDRIVSSFDSNVRLQSVRSDVRRQIDVDQLACANFLEFSARVPIPVYLKYKTQENPYIYQIGVDYGVGLLYNVVFGELWFRNPEVRLDVLDFLIQGRHCPPLEFLRIAKDKAKHGTLITPENYHDDKFLFTYFTQVKGMLGSRIWNPLATFACWLEQARYLWRRRRQLNKNIGL